MKLSEGIVADLAQLMTKRVGLIVLISFLVGFAAAMIAGCSDHESDSDLVIDEIATADPGQNNNAASTAVPQNEGTLDPKAVEPSSPNQPASTNNQFGQGTKKFGEKCGGAEGECEAGLLCIQFNESGSDIGYCTAQCSDKNPCPQSPAGAQCVFELSDKKTVCGFVCDEAKPTCPNGLSCTYSEEGQYYYCSTDEPARCGNGKTEMGEECDGSDYNNTTCQSLGYASGAIKCSNTCKLDKIGCTGKAACQIPPRDCTLGSAACGKLVPFSPVSGTGYIVTHGDALSWIRQDTMMLVKYAAASVACAMPGSAPIATGDMSMKDGSIPKDSDGSLRHPEGTHEGGADMDIAYFQTGMPNNYLREVCPHITNGQEQYHCTSAPTSLDGPRTAYFIAKLLESKRVRVLGVDGKVGPLVIAETQKLVQNQKLPNSSITALNNKLAYEPTDKGEGWYLFHHHHMHLSTTDSSYLATYSYELTNSQVPSIFTNSSQALFNGQHYDLSQLNRAAIAPSAVPVKARMISK